MWTGRKPKDWIGKTIVSQYGLICKVIDAKDANDETIITATCRKNKTWEWSVCKVSLVTRENEILDSTGEIFGKIINGHWKLYPDSECRTITQKEIDNEFTG